MMKLPSREKLQEYLLSIGVSGYLVSLPLMVTLYNYYPHHDKRIYAYSGGTIVFITSMALARVLGKD